MSTTGTEQDERLHAIERRAAAATPGPWRVFVESDTENEIESDVDGGMGVIWRGAPSREASAEFIAHAREDVPYLIAALRDARADRDAIGAARDALAERYGDKDAELAAAKAEARGLAYTLDKVTVTLRDARAKATNWEQSYRILDRRMVSMRDELRVKLAAVRELAERYRTLDDIYCDGRYIAHQIDDALAAAVCEPEVHGPLDSESLSAREDLVTDAELTGLERQIELDRREGHQTGLAERLIRELRDARAEAERLANRPYCCPPCAVHPDPEAREIERIAASINMAQIVAQGGVDTGWLVAHVLRESGIQAERDDLRTRLAAAEQAPDLMARLKTETSLRIEIVTAKRQLAAVRASAPKLREIAEMWLYDGDHDQPRSDDYYTLLDLAAALSSEGGTDNG